jgi:hypothetical protein
LKPGEARISHSMNYDLGPGIFVLGTDCSSSTLTGWVEGLRGLGGMQLHLDQNNNDTLDSTSILATS